MTEDTTEGEAKRIAALFAAGLIDESDKRAVETIVGTKTMMAVDVYLDDPDFVEGANAHVAEYGD